MRSSRAPLPPVDNYHTSLPPLAPAGGALLALHGPMTSSGVPMPPQAISSNYPVSLAASPSSAIYPVQLAPLSSASTFLPMALPATADNHRLPLAPLTPGTSNVHFEKPMTLFSNAKEQTTAKRPHSAVEADHEGEDDMPITDSCDIIRRKINAFLSSREMEVTEFIREIGVNSDSYGCFMKLKGRYSGVENQTYEAAFKFFQKRKASGMDEVPKKKAKKEEDVKKVDVLDIQLEGEENDSVRIYDTCDDIRQKIAEYLREPNITQAGFLRDIGKLFSESRTIQSKQLKDFQAKKGPLAGNSSSVFYGSYVFFEKLRIKQKKPKSKKREEMEAVWNNGIDRSRPQSYNARKDEEVVLDQYGHPLILRK
ncbi:hypothetical protein MMC07_004720 [Pseudocyphellaria aurata]|nr:hypothetical protein [Pseudocyphellaria aurata]